MFDFSKWHQENMRALKMQNLELEDTKCSVAHSFMHKWVWRDFSKIQNIRFNDFKILIWINQHFTPNEWLKLGVFNWDEIYH